MRQYLFGYDDIVADFVAKNTRATFEKYTAIGILEDGKLIAGVVYHNYMPEYKNIELSIFSTTPRWATKDAIKIILRYPFFQLKCRRVTAQVAARNDRALKFTQGIGFRKEGRVRLGYGNDDLIVLGMMYKEAKRWLNPAGNRYNGQEFTKTAASTRP